MITNLLAKLLKPRKGEVIQRNSCPPALDQHGVRIKDHESPCMIVATACHATQMYGSDDMPATLPETYTTTCMHESRMLHYNSIYDQ